MESPTLARQSVSADLSEFARAELEAFVAQCKRERPAAWALVEQLQLVCRAAFADQKRRNLGGAMPRARGV